MTTYQTLSQGDKGGHELCTNKANRLLPETNIYTNNLVNKSAIVKNVMVLLWRDLI